jgi:hypothetical protein
MSGKQILSETSLNVWSMTLKISTKSKRKASSRYEDTMPVIQQRRFLCSCCRLRHHQSSHQFDPTGRGMPALVNILCGYA